MFKLKLDPPKDELRPPRKWLSWRLALPAQFLLVLVLGVAIWRDAQMPSVESSEDNLTRVRYLVSRQEWPGGPPTLAEIRDRYAGDLPAMRVSNEPGACADPGAPIDYGDTVFIEFSSAEERCREEEGTRPGRTSQ